MMNIVTKQITGGEKMARSDLIEIDGTIIDILPGGKYLVELDSNDENKSSNKLRATCHLGGKLRVAKINIVKGDKVSVSLSPYDLTRGKIDWRYK